MILETILETGVLQVSNFEQNPPPIQNLLFFRGSDLFLHPYHITAFVAQLAARGSHNPKVAGSIPVESM